MQLPQAIFLSCQLIAFGIVLQNGVTGQKLTLSKLRTYINIGFISIEFLLLVWGGLFLNVGLVQIVFIIWYILLITAFFKAMDKSVNNTYKYSTKIKAHLGLSLIKLSLLYCVGFFN